MKKLLKFLCLLLTVSLTSCKSIVSNQGKPLEDTSLELNQKYEVQDFTAKIHKIKITSIDGKNIYGISKKGDFIAIDKKTNQGSEKSKSRQFHCCGYYGNCSGHICSNIENNI